jgi:hypothetical protein
MRTSPRHMTDRLLVALARLATLPLHAPAKRAQQ